MANTSAPHVVSTFSAPGAPTGESTGYIDQYGTRWRANGISLRDQNQGRRGTLQADGRILLH